MNNEDPNTDLSKKSNEALLVENSTTSKFFVSASKLNATLTLASIGITKICFEFIFKGSVGLMLGFAFGARRGLAGANVNGEGLGLGTMRHHILKSH